MEARKPTGPLRSRRWFLGAAAYALGRASLARSTSSDVGEESAEKLFVDPGAKPVAVRQARSRFAIDGPVVHPEMFRELLQAAVAGVLGTKTIGEAWKMLFRPDDIIGLKFNQSGQDVIATTGTVAEILVDSIVRAGFSARQIVCIEAPPSSAVHEATTPAAKGFESNPTDFGSGSDEFARALSQVSAIVNVPYLKTHNITGLTCALKNLSHGLVKHPARYHKNGCCPYIADINLHPRIRKKVRLCIVDALRVVFDRGPEASARTIANEGILVATTDPVAADTVGLSILNEVRAARGLDTVARSPARVPYLADAHRKGLGIAARHGIHVSYDRLS